MPSDSKSHKTMARIIEAATRHFARHGFDGARMDTIAGDAGVNKATIYYHLGGKKALYTAVLHAAFDERAAHIAEQVKTATTAERKLKVIFRGLRRLISDTPHISAIMMREVASGGRNFPEILLDDFSRIIGLTAEVLGQGHNSGQWGAAHPLVVYLMAIAPMAYYEKIDTGLKKFLVSGSDDHNVPVISFQEFADQVETLIVKALKA